MMLVEQTTIPSEVLPNQAFKDHLKLGTGFADDDLQDAVLDRYLRAALAVIEGHTGKAVFTRSFAWSVAAWRDFASQTLPIAPVTQVLSLEIHDGKGGVEVIDPSRYRLVQDAHKPRIVTAGYTLPPIPVGGTAQMVFVAGLASTWEEVGYDLAQAILLLAAHFYEERSSVADIPRTVSTLLQRYRDVRLFGGLRG